MNQLSTMLRPVVCLGLQLGALCSTACKPEPLAQLTGITMHVQFQTHQGRLVRGGWVDSMLGKQHAADGSLDLVLPFDERGQRIVVNCPLLFEGVTERYLMANTLSAGGKMEMTMFCEPLERVTGLSVHSDCKDAQLFLDDRTLGQLKDGWFYAWVTESNHAARGRSHAHPTLLIARAQPGCRFIDPLTQRSTSQIEVALSFSPSGQAVWTDLQGVVQTPTVRRAPKKPPRRPYRL